ncbi:MAG: glycine betaine ABC transporter substrate-binding protein, partial [Pseudomonas putida]
MHKFSAAVFALALGTATTHAADSDAQCSTVKMADPGWSDIASTNAVARLLLESLGYQVKIDSLAVPIIYGGLKDGRVDAFLGNWMPAHQGFHDKFIANGDVQQLSRNLEGTEFTLAV